MLDFHSYNEPMIIESYEKEENKIINQIELSSHEVARLLKPRWIDLKTKVIGSCGYYDYMLSIYKIDGRWWGLNWIKGVTKDIPNLYPAQIANEYFQEEAIVSSFERKIIKSKQNG